MTDPSWWPGEGERPDYRFSLADEGAMRTGAALPAPLLAVRMTTAVAVGGPSLALLVLASR